MIVSGMSKPSWTASGRKSKSHQRGWVVLVPVFVLSTLALACIPIFASLGHSPTRDRVASPRPRVPASPSPEYLWFEAENMRGFATDRRGEPILNPSWLNLPKAKAPGWGINGPGVSAEWSQGGESEWNSAAASADENTGELYQDFEIPRSGVYKLWVRYADWANKAENFVVRINQNNREVFRHEFGTRDVVDPHDEVSMYWNWAFAWDTAQAQSVDPNTQVDNDPKSVIELKKGPARVSIVVEKGAAARRHVDCVLITSELSYVPSGRSKPDFAGMRYLRAWSKQRRPLTSLTTSTVPATVPDAWRRPEIAGRDFLMPWNIAKEFWATYDQPESERSLYPFHAEPIEQFVATYKGARDVPIFASKLVVPVIYINDLNEYLKEGSLFLRYLRTTKTPFAVLINYGTIQMTAEEGNAAWALLNGELRSQFLGWVSGESIGYVYTTSAATDLKISPAMSRAELLEAHRLFYTNALDKKWSAIFHTATGPMWDKLIPAQATSSTTYAHALARWGVRLLGMETPAVQPMLAMRIAFTRGAARQYGGAFAYYHAPNFGDTATTFTKQQNFAGPDNFFHSRYGPSMGPSLSWYRKSYYMYYMSGVSAIYLEQGFDQFFKPGPGEHLFQLNPLGRITDEFMRFAEQHPDRGTPYTPVAFLLDPAHGWDMTDYPQWPFGVSQISRSDRALRELFGVAYFPGLVVEGEPASGDRQAFVSGVFGNIFDVLVAADVSSSEFRVQSSTLAASSPKSLKTSSATSSKSALPVSPFENYRAVVVGGHIDLTRDWVEKLTTYVRGGGTVVINAAQAPRVSEQLVGIRFTNATEEADSARCSGEPDEDLSGQLFRYEKVELKGATTLVAAPNGDPLVTVNKIGKGSVVFNALPDLLGIDGRVTPFSGHMLAHVFADATPIKVTGDVEYLINRNNSGWVVSLFNNNGVNKPQQGLATVDRSANVKVTVSISGQPLRSAVDWISDKPLQIKKAPNSLVVTLAPGGIAIVEMK